MGLLIRGVEALESIRPADTVVLAKPARALSSVFVVLNSLRLRRFRGPTSGRPTGPRG